MRRTGKYFIEKTAFNPLTWECRHIVPLGGPDLMLRYNSVKCRFLKWEDLTLHCECLLANEGPFRHVSIHALKWRVRREGEFVVHSIYFMATDFKQISDYPYCLIICLGGWAICEMLAFQMLEQCALNVYSKTSPPSSAH